MVLDARRTRFFGPVDEDCHMILLLRRCTLHVPRPSSSAVDSNPPVGHLLRPAQLSQELMSQRGYKVLSSFSSQNKARTAHNRA